MRIGSVGRVGQGLSHKGYDISSKEWSMGIVDVVGKIMKCSQVHVLGMFCDRGRHKNLAHKNQERPCHCAKGSGDDQATSFRVPVCNFISMPKARELH